MKKTWKFHASLKENWSMIHILHFYKINKKWFSDELLLTAKQ